MTLVGSSVTLGPNDLVRPNDVDLLIGYTSVNKNLLKAIFRQCLIAAIPEYNSYTQLHMLEQSTIDAGWPQFRMIPPQDCKGFILGAAFHVLGNLVGVNVGYRGLYAKKDGSIQQITQNPTLLMAAIETHLQIPVTGAAWSHVSLGDLLRSLKYVCDITSSVQDLDTLLMTQLKRYSDRSDYEVLKTRLFAALEDM